MLLDSITELSKVLTIKKLACSECGAMYSRVRMESYINRLDCKYNARLAKSRATKSITYRRDDGSYETIH